MKKINGRDNNGSRHGIWLGRYFDGKLRYIIKYLNGKQHGWQFYFNNNGEIINTKLMFKGDLILVTKKNKLII